MNTTAHLPLDDAWRLVEAAGTICAVMHVNPDGDALGSALGLTMGLRAMGRNIHLVCPQRTPEVYDFLHPERTLTQKFPEGRPDLVIVLDCDRPERTGELEEFVRSARSALVIDHHPNGCDFGDVRLVDDGAAATSEMVFRFLQHRNVEITRSMAEALLTGLVTDTGTFRFSNTRAETLEAAAALTRVGPPVAEVAERVYETRSMAGLKLLGRTLDSLKASLHGHVAWATLSAQDFQETGAKPEDTEGFVNVIHTLKGADVAAILREETPGTVRVSLRGRGDTPVNKAAEALGGGGHELAAACVLEDSLPDAERRVLEELKKWTEF